MTGQSHFSQWEPSINQHRNYLISFAYRMSGSWSIAEDIVQDTFLECADVDPKTISNHKSWLTKVCSNKALDHLKRAYVKRETYPGVWLPDAIPEQSSMWDVLVTNEQSEKYFLQQESLSTSFLLLIDKLSPEERVVYLLSEIFDYSFKEIATFLDKSDGACRKMAERARKAIESEKSFPIQNTKAKKLVADFFAMAKMGDTEALMKLLDKQSEFWGDGGGKAPVFSPTVMKGIDWIVETFKKLGAAPVFGTYKFSYSLINSEPGVLITKIDENGKEKIETLFTFEFRDDKIYKIFAQRNPDKFPTLD